MDVIELQYRLIEREVGFLHLAATNSEAQDARQRLLRKYPNLLRWGSRVFLHGHALWGGDFRGLASGGWCAEHVPVMFWAQPSRLLRVNPEGFDESRYIPAPRGRFPVAIYEVDERGNINRTYGSDLYMRDDMNL